MQCVARPNSVGGAAGAEMLLAERGRPDWLRLHFLISFRFQV